MFIKYNWLFIIGTHLALPLQQLSAQQIAGQQLESFNQQPNNQLAQFNYRPQFNYQPLPNQINHSNAQSTAPTDFNPLLNYNQLIN